MASKKDFTAQVMPDALASNIETVMAQPDTSVMPRRSRTTPPTEDEMLEAREQGRTQGRKGTKALRINMAFPPEMYDFIRRMAKFRGESITVYCQHIIQLYMDQHMDDYEQILDFMERT